MHCYFWELLTGHSSSMQITGFNCKTESKNIRKYIEFLHHLCMKSRYVKIVIGQTVGSNIHKISFSKTKSMIKHIKVSSKQLVISNLAILNSCKALKIQETLLWSLEEQPATVWYLVNGKVITPMTIFDTDGTRDEIVSKRSFCSLVSSSPDFWHQMRTRCTQMSRLQENIKDKILRRGCTRLYTD